MKTETTLLERLAKRAKMNRKYSHGGEAPNPSILTKKIKLFQLMIIFHH